MPAQLVGSADGDSSKGVNDALAGSTNTTGNQAKTTKKKDDAPGQRLYNPLGNYPTYTYNLSLYMITPKAYDAFMATGRTKVDISADGGAVLVAQSGGINSTTQTRGAGFSLDYYIDNLRITTATSGPDTTTSTNTTELEFTITEPYGFSFISNLKACADDLIAKSKEEGLENLDNASRQFFILGIRFTGFKNDGTPISTKDEPLFERFYDIYITNMSFKLDNKATNYSIKATSAAPGIAFGTKRGVWDTGGTLRGRTVYEMLNNMMAQMNKQSADLVKGKDIKPNKYEFKFIGTGFDDSEASQRASPIFSAKMVSESEVTKQTLVGSVPPTTDGKQPSDQGKPDPTIGEITIPPHTPILQAFQLIIARSNFITNAFKTIQTNVLENNENKAKGTTDLKTDSQAIVQWYNVSAACKNGKYNKDIADFTWDINYVFTLYETPVVTNPFSNLGVNYYGPHKRYDYWFTGKNSEIISYTQNLDNTFFNVTVNPTDINEETDTSQALPNAQGKPANTEKTGTLNQQDTMKKSYITSLFDPGAYASATIKILGDPDYLMPESTSDVSNLYRQFYGTQDFTINPNGGQVFIEIDFKEPQDYGFKTTDNITFTGTGDGLLSVNDKIQFWQYPEEIQKLVKGVSYRLQTVKSVFNQGKFEQELTCIINTFNGYTGKGSGAEREAAAGTAAGGREGQAAGGSGQTSNNGSNTKLVTDPKQQTNSKGPGTTTNSTSSNAGQQQTTNTPNGPVANGDADPTKGPSTSASTSKNGPPDQQRGG